MKELPLFQISTSSRGRELPNSVRKYFPRRQLPRIFPPRSFLPRYLFYTLLGFLQGIAHVNQTNFPNALSCPCPIADDFTYPEEFQLHRKQT